MNTLIVIFGICSIALNLLIYPNSCNLKEFLMKSLIAHVWFIGIIFLSFVYVLVLYLTINLFV